VIQLFSSYQSLQQRLPYTSLCELPTPVHKLERLGKELGLTELYIKRDDLSGAQYGGNKPRKLEFILGKALRAGTSSVMTLGGAGSNHALATAIYSRKVGLESISMLMPQPNAHYVRRNLLISHYYDAELHLCGTGLDSVFNMPLVRLAIMYQKLRHRLKNGRSPQFILPGGSSPMGAIGFVNAGFELKEQVLKGEIPEPDYIYVACGTMGTAAGLVIGLKAAELKTRVVAVRVTSEKFVHYRGMLKLINGTNTLLHSLDESFPLFCYSVKDVDIRQDYFGVQYAAFTEKGVEAISLMNECEKIKLEGTYTGKAMAALIDDARSGKIKDKVILFWNTVNSRNFPEIISHLDYHDLPQPFHRYFGEEVQPLDQNH